MKLPFSFTNTASNANTALYFLLKLFGFVCLLKVAFFGWNYTIANGWSVKKLKDIFTITGWSVLYDAFTLSALNLPLFFLLWCNKTFFKITGVHRTLIVFFSLLNAFCLVLNVIDIFYYRFHLQRADADLLYVLRNPFNNGSTTGVLILVAGIFAFILACIIIQKSIAKAATHSQQLLRATIVTALITLTFFVTGTKKILPASPLTQLKPEQLPLVQNSMHTFLYSLYRSKEEMIPDKLYMNDNEAALLVPVIKKNAGRHAPKNIVLFIMESVPLDFFDSSSTNKVRMPFLDSLVKKSTFYSNAYSYAYTSNKGIASILAGIPTTTDIPLYHSGFTTIEKTAIGEALSTKNYNSSFFIGDNYDDFGFAKCCNWLGIQQYYCMQDIPGYRQMEKHTMGLHDEYVLQFMQEKLRRQQEPFFSLFYNISTHYPNDLSKNFQDLYPGVNTTPPMKSMAYYDQCLHHFFSAAQQQKWFGNSVFIFCSDHWATPRRDSVFIDAVESFRIPVFIYDPQNEQGSTITNTVSQLDIMNTILYYAGYDEKIRSYGFNLMNTALDPNRTVFTKTNSSIYQAINNHYVLGFDAAEGQPVYCYDYINDRKREINLLQKAGFTKADTLILQMKACLQNLYKQYKKR